ncbi:MAG: COX15/CtaA family protein [Parvularculaceae bacterium]
MPPPAAPNLNPVSTWLFVMCALVALMVVVGGATRLTDSGLSIVEWRPIHGAIPPLGAAQWLEEFEKYKTIPEYELVNKGMSLAEFKEIYWWEWGHRFLGRLLGAAFLLPFLFFVLTRRVTGALTLKLGGVFLLGGAQGALGWYMVSSGLSERIDVSQYRLAAHLALAVLLFGLMFWLALSLRRASDAQGDGRSAASFAMRSFGTLLRMRRVVSWKKGPRPEEPPQAASRRTAADPGVASRNPSGASFALAAAVFVQMILGAFVAGLDAGRVFNTWPLMDGAIAPAGYFVGEPGVSDLFESPAAAQFNHRIGAYLLLAGALWFYAAARKTKLARPALLLLAAIVAQAILGIATLLAATPIALGLAHQALALIVFACALYAAHSSVGAASFIAPASPGTGGANSGIASPGGGAPSR